MSEVSECNFGPAGSREAASARLDWAKRRVGLVAMGQVRNGVPYHEELAGPGGMGYVLLPFAGQSREAVEAAARHIRERQDVVRMSVAHVDCEGYPLRGDTVPLRVLLAARGNPDYGQDPTVPPYGAPPDRFVTVESLDEAKSTVTRYIANNDLGGGQWVGGDVWQGGRRLGGISYNGRFWEANREDGYGLSSVEFAERMRPNAGRVRRLLATALDGDAPSDLEYDAEPEFSLARFEQVRSADAWRVWYAEQIEANPRLGERTASPALEPVHVLVRDDEMEILSEVDECRIGAAFLRGDACINAVVIDGNALRQHAAP